MRMIFAAIVAAILFSAPATAQTKVRKTAFEVVPAGRSHDGDGPVYFYAKDTTGHFAALFHPGRGVGCAGGKMAQRHIKGATAALADLLGYGADSALLKKSRYFVDTLKKRDTYGRIVGSIWRVDEDGTTYDIGYQMVNQGWAWYVYGSGLPRSVEKLYSAAEKKARQTVAGCSTPTRSQRTTTRAGGG